MEAVKTFYLCDGSVETCKCTHCYKTGGPCRHTQNAAHALTTGDSKEFVRIGDNLFEKGPEKYEQKT